MLVLGPNGKTAEECYVAAINQTVAEANPEYPASDPVADVAFIEDIEDSMGIGFGTDDVPELYADGDLDRARIKVCGYPESRLALAGRCVGFKPSGCVSVHGCPLHRQPARALMRAGTSFPLGSAPTEVG